MRLIDADDFGNRMYHETFEKDSEDQRWDSGCWMRYKLFERVLREQPEVQLSPIEKALHGLSPEEQADFLINLMRGTLAYIDSRVALIKWLERGHWNGKTD